MDWDRNKDHTIVARVREHVQCLVMTREYCILGYTP